MKTKISVRVTALAIIMSLVCAFMPCLIYAQTDIPSVGDIVNGFKVVSVKKFEYINSGIITFKHEKTGATVLYCANDDINRAFDISFKTPALNERGTPHVFEHSTLSGSKNYPSSTLFMKVMNQTYNTYMNAMTYQNNTNYPIASLSEKQLYSLTDYYLDCVFNPNIYSDSFIIEREAWRYELEGEDDDLKISGTVYSEMQGSEDILNASYFNTKKTLFPDSYMSNISGGDPYKIPELTNDEIINYHRKYYQPSNSLSVLYGKIEYKDFLKLLDNYFSKYEKQDIDIDFASYTPTQTKHIEKTYEYPVYENAQTNTKSYISYSFECKDADKNDVALLSSIIYILNSQGSEINKRAATELPGVSISCSFDINNPEPTVMFFAQNIDIADKDKFKKIIDECIKAMIDEGIDAQSKNAFVAQLRRSEAKGVSGGNLGVSLALEIAQLWAIYDDVDYLFDLSDINSSPKELVDNKRIKDVMKKYLTASSRTAIVSTIPVLGLKNKIQEDLKKELQEKKESMSKEEINQIVEKTKDYLQKAEMSNDELDKPLLDKINVVKAHELPEEVKDYSIKDTQKDNVRYVTAVADIKDIGKGRIMIDVSDISGEDLYWLSLYRMLIGNVNTKKYTQAQININAKLYADCSTDIITLGSNDKFTPYLIFKYEGFSDESEQIFDIAEQILFESDFTNVKGISNIVNQSINMFETNIEQFSYNYMATRAFASSNNNYAYYQQISGLGFYEFIKKIGIMLESNPNEVTANLEKIKSMLYNKNGASVVYAGTEDSIKNNTIAAEKFFADMPYAEKKTADFSSLKTKYQSEALIVNSNVNYNGIYAPLDILGLEYSGKMNVVMNYIQDRYLIPELRNKYNVYGIIGDCNEEGVIIYSYRDPGVKNTFNVYEKLSKMIKDSTITQQEVDKYILSVYSNLIMPKGELHDAYWAAADYTNGAPISVKLNKMKDIKNTTVEDVKSYEKVFDKLWSDGTIFTSGSLAVIDENKNLYDEILDPLSYIIKDNAADKITIMINGQELKTDIPAIIANDITMIPMRNIFEKLNAEVEWDSVARQVIAKKDGKVILITIDSNVIVVKDENGNEYELVVGSPAVIIDDYTMIPLRAVSETLGFKVEWDSNTRTAYIQQ